MAGLRTDLERMFRNRDSGLVAGGPFECVYAEQYVESLDAQGVSRTITLPRHIADEREMVPGVEVSIIETVDDRHLGPFTVETYEPAPGGIVTMQLSERVA